MVAELRVTVSLLILPDNMPQLPQLTSHQPAAEDQQPPLLGIMVDHL
jgi:hypothetical protein